MPNSFYTQGDVMIGYERMASTPRRSAKLHWIYWAASLIFIITSCSSTTTPIAEPAPEATDLNTPTAFPVLVTETQVNVPTATAVQETLSTLPPAPTAVTNSYRVRGQPLKLLNIHMIDEQNGWAIESGDFNHILHTKDGGHSWRDVTPYHGYGYPRYFANGFFALDANTAWATTPQMPACDIQNSSCVLIPDTALIWHTIDGGRTWQGQFVTAVPYGSIPMSIQFLDAQTGWMLVMSFLDGGRQYHLYQTIDGGTHWSEAMEFSSGTAPEELRGQDITAIAIQDSKTAWMSTTEICCEEHLIMVKEWNVYRSTDAGITWEKFILPAPNPLPETLLHNSADCTVHDVQAKPSNVLDITIYCYVYEGGLRSYSYFHYHSGDGGRHWVFFPKNRDVKFIDASLGWRMTPRDGVYDLERTQDGGVTWITLKTVLWNGQLDFVNKFIGWALINSDEDITFLHTVDGGRTWEEIKPVVSGN